MRFPILIAVVLLGFTGAASAQMDDPPKILKPTPPTRKELNKRDSLKQYVLGLQYEQDDRFEDAIRAFEEAARLDPDAPAVFKAQVAILVAMQRLTDALTAAKKVVALDPGDYTMWYAQAKLHRKFARYPEAIEAMQGGLKSERIADHPEAAQQMYLELGELCESTNQFGPAADAYKKAAVILEHPDRIMQKGPFPRELILARALPRPTKRSASSIARRRSTTSRLPR